MENMTIKQNHNVFMLLFYYRVLYIVMLNRDK